MSDLSGTSLAGPRIAVIGAGAVGLCLSVRLARAGARTILFDPADAREEASGVAAGMLAPIGEALFDDPIHLPFWRAAAARWPSFAASVPGLRVEACGARFLGLETPDAALALRADLSDPSVFLSDEDARLDPPPTLAALERAFLAAGGERRRQSMERLPTDADFTVIAAGFASRGLAHLAEELGVLTPIKGQLLRFEGGPAEGPILRSPQGYLVPGERGAVVGATMEFGVDNRMPTEAGRERLLQVAEALHPGLSQVAHRVVAGVRAAAPDGLPMVGPSKREGVLLATAMRRNGWLLAPLVSEIITAHLSGGEAGPFARSLDPRRFALPKPEAT